MSFSKVDFGIICSLICIDFVFDAMFARAVLADSVHTSIAHNDIFRKSLLEIPLF